MFAPFDPFHCFVPNQFEPVATVAINRHSKQAVTYEAEVDGENEEAAC